MARGNLPAMLDLPPDVNDEAMVELAIALSLQDQGDGGVLQRGLQRLANLGVTPQPLLQTGMMKILIGGGAQGAEVKVTLVLQVVTLVEALKTVFELRLCQSVDVALPMTQVELMV